MVLIVFTFYHKALWALLDLIMPRPKLSHHDTQRMISYLLNNKTNSHPKNRVVIRKYTFVFDKVKKRLNLHCIIILTSTPLVIIYFTFYVYAWSL